MKVHYTTLEDMSKYNPNFNKELYKDKEEDEVNQEFSEWYSKHLPIDLLTWSRVNGPKDEMIYKNGFWDQIIFIRDTINPMFYSTYEEFKDNPVMVINIHKSKSILLPVYEIDLKQYKLKIILRNNFYDWKVSLISVKAIETDFMGLFKKDKTINSVYCEGFKEEQVFPSYKDNKNKFTIEIHSKYQLYTFMFLLNNYFNNTKYGCV